MKFSMKKIISAVLILVMMLSFASCKADPEEFYIEGNPSVTIQVGETILLSLVKPDGLKGKPDWTSSDESVAIVVDGAVKGLKTGTAVITASLDDYYDKVMVSVTSPKDNNTGNNTGDNTGNNTGS